MSTSSPVTTGDLSRFDRTTSIWGPITMGAGFLVSLAAALYVVFGTGLGITGAELWTAVGAVLATFAIIAVIEPISYYPILGRSAMYQAFMIGNISNKLLPAAIVAQANLDEKPGSRRAELIAGSAIIGAVIVHLTTLVILVGALGTWLVSLLPPELIAVARAYILPAVFGAVVLQLIVSMKAVRTTIIAIIVAVLVDFVLIPLVPSLMYVATAIAVVATILLAWFLRDKKATAPAEVSLD
ncbi:hypothetical protein [Microbacterium sp.]|uniref:hypothetical protein n=1 Tax=Microbacterium sp. TaxID=51671 RepID=UPI003C72D3AE